MENIFKDKPRVEKMAKDSIGNSGRKMLSDISNIPRKSSMLAQDNKSRPSSVTVKEYIEQLQKENSALMKLVADKNRIIDLSGAELHKLRITLQKMQQQNLQLAQANSQMLAELGSAKDRLKDMQHQLGCKNSLLAAKKLELERKRKLKTCETNDIKKLKVSEREETGVSVAAESDKDQQCNTIGRQKSKSSGPCVRKGQDKVDGENGRLQARKQSARFKNDKPKAKEDFFHTDTVDLPPSRLPDDAIPEDDFNSVIISAMKEEVEDNTSGKKGKRKLKTFETNGIKKVKVSAREDTGVWVSAENYKDQECNTNGRQKSKSLGPSVRKVQEKSIGDNGRLRGSRQSARFKHDEPKPKEEVLYTNNVNLHLCRLPDDKMREDDSNSVAFSAKKEAVEDITLPDKVTKECKRSSSSRPSRVAATKVQSYKEMNLVMKMRRPE